MSKRKGKQVKSVNNIEKRKGDEDEEIDESVGNEMASLKNKKYKKRKRTEDEDEGRSSASEESETKKAVGGKLHKSDKVNDDTHSVTDFLNTDDEDGTKTPPATLSILMDSTATITATGTPELNGKSSEESQKTPKRTVLNSQGNKTPNSSNRSNENAEDDDLPFSDTLEGMRVIFGKIWQIVE